jgi:hypothetical protein
MNNIIKNIGKVSRPNLHKLVVPMRFSDWRVYPYSGFSISAVAGIWWLKKQTSGKSKALLTKHRMLFNLNTN